MQEPTEEPTADGPLRWLNPDDAPDDALSGRQLVELKEGVRAAISHTDGGLGIPGALHGTEWTHSGIGVSVYTHRSGVVVMTTGSGRSGRDSIVTDVDTLNHMDTALAAFEVNHGRASVASENVKRLDN